MTTDGLDTGLPEIYEARYFGPDDEWPEDREGWLYAGREEFADVWMVPANPNAWGITDWEALLGNMRVAETAGDFTECADALAAALEPGGPE